MEIHVCIKQTYDPNTLEPDPTTSRPFIEKAQIKLSDFDLNALEEGLRIREKIGGRVVILTVGRDIKPLLIREALAMGADEAYVVSDDMLAQADAFVYSNVLTSLSRKIGKADLILCGECSVDEGGYQVGPRIAAQLGIPSVTHAVKLEVQGNKLIAERSLEEHQEVLEIPLPAVATVGLEINTPRLPSLLMIRAASKKPIHNVSIADLGLSESDLEPKVRVDEVRAAKVERRRVVLTGSLEEVADKLLSELVREGVIRL